MIYINWIIELINNIPNILQYVIYGYIYLTAYYWIGFKDNKDFKNFLIKSVAVSYIIIIIFDTILYKFNIILSNEFQRNILLIISSGLFGLLFGQISTCHWFNNILYYLHIGRTTNTNVWDDVIKPYTWVRVYMKDNSSYLGQYRFGEPFKSEPIIVLIAYKKLDKDGIVVLDYSENFQEMIMINTKDFDRIEIIHG